MIRKAIQEVISGKELDLETLAGPWAVGRICPWLRRGQRSHF